MLDEHTAEICPAQCVAAEPARSGGAKRGRPKLDADRQRARIYTVAADLFVQHGFDRVSLSSVARAAGITKRTIYLLVGDKEALFRYACTTLCSEWCMFVFPDRIEGRQTRDILLVMARMLARDAIDPRTLPFRRMIAAEARRFPELLVDAMSAGRTIMHEAIASIFSDLKDRGMIAPIDSGQAADLFYDTIVGGKAMRAVMGYDEPFPDDAELEQRVDMILKGYLAAP
jgi:TetR/AcrR family transcriptional regulator, mexJK operon transcriptional repressor